MNLLMNSLTTQNQKYWEINSEDKVNFQILFTHSILSQFKILDNLSETQRIFLLVDENIWEIYKNQFEILIQNSCKKLYIKTIKPDEKNKNIESTIEIIQFLDDKSLKRKSEPIIAIGGGVILDIASFAASIYRRGVPIIKIPTNLLAIVDACVGVKTGVNFGIKRNRIGTYYPPQKVLIDKSFLKTCPQRHITNGLGEIFKIALIKSSSLFSQLEAYAETVGIEEKLCIGALASKIINDSITLMLEELQPNLWEKNLQRCVDFGHSFSPYIELKNINELLHGEAVTLDCLFSTCLALNLNFISKDKLLRIYRLAKSLGLPLFHKDFTNKKLIETSLKETKAHRNGNLNLPIPSDIGKYIFINELSDEIIDKTINFYQKVKDEL